MFYWKVICLIYSVINFNHIFCLFIDCLSMRCSRHYTVLLLLEQADPVDKKEHFANIPIKMLFLNVLWMVKTSSFKNVLKTFCLDYGKGTIHFANIMGRNVTFKCITGRTFVLNFERTLP